MERTYASTVGQSEYATGQVVDWSAPEDEDFGELPIPARTVRDAVELEIEERFAYEADREQDKAKQVVLDVLGVSEDEWTKYMRELKPGHRDADNRLIIASYDEDKIMKNPLPLRLQEIRGVVVDTKARAVVCAGSEFTERITVTSLNVIDDPTADSETKKAVRVHSKVLGRDLDFHIETDATTRAGYYSQGMNLKVFLHNGKLRVITNNHVDPSGEIRGGAKKSAFNFNEPFTDSFYHLLPKEKLRTLFPKGCRYSPFSYNFLLSMPWNATATRVEIPQKGYITFIRKDKLWDLDDETCPFKRSREDVVEEGQFWVGAEPDEVGLEESDFKEFFTKGTKLNYNANEGLPLPDKPSFNYRKRILSVDDVEQLLFTKARSLEERSFYGEAVILTKIVELEDGRKVFYSVRLQPPAYEWRDKFFQEKKTQSGTKGGDIYETYLDFLTQGAPPTMEMLEKRFPIYGKRIPGYGWNLADCLENLKEGRRYFTTGLGLSFERLDAKKMTFPQEANWEDVVTLFFIFLTSPSRQMQVVGCYRRYRTERNRLADYLMNNYFIPKDKNSIERAKPHYTVMSSKGEKQTDLFRFAVRCFDSPDYKANRSEVAREENRKLIFKLLNRNPGIEKKAILQQATSLTGSETVSAETLHRSMMVFTSLYPEGVRALPLDKVGINLRNIKKNKKAEPRDKGEYKRAEEKNKVKRPTKNQNFRPVRQTKY